MHMARTLIILALVAVFHGLPAAKSYQSVIKLRNGTLIVNTTSPDVQPEDAFALDVLQYSLGQGVGQAARADYASAYISPEDPSMLINGTNPLESRATVEANNTYVLINGTGSPYKFSSLELVLGTNNTFQLDGADLGLDYSTIRLADTNWFLITNGSRLGLNVSRLDFRNYFTWLVKNSTVNAKTSIINLKNVLTWWDSSKVNLNNSTFNITSDFASPPALYETLQPVVYINDTAVNVTGTSWVVENVPLVQVTGNTFNLANSTLTLRNSTLHYYGTTLDLNLSDIIAENSTIVLFGNSTGGNVTSLKVFSGAPNTTGSALVGKNLGAVDTSLLKENLDVYV